MKAFLVLIILFLLVPAITFSQDTTEEPEEEESNRIKSAVNGMVQSHRYRIGIFRILPTLGIRSGYDSNALYEDDEPIGDYYLSVQPAANVAVKLGDSAYFALLEEVTLLWYKELDQRRDVQNNTRAQFVTGSSRMLVTVDGGYNTRKNSYDDELDIPIESKVFDTGIVVDYTLTSKIGLSNGFRYIDTDLKAEPDVAPLPFDPTDRRTYNYHSGLTYEFRRTLHLTTDLVLGRSTALETDRTTQHWSVLQGAHWLRTKLNIHGRAGYGRAGDVDSDEASRSHFLFGVDLNYSLPKRLSVGAFVSRNFEFTALSDDVTLVTTAGGRVSISIPITDRWSADASYTAGYRYRDDNLVIEGEAIDAEFYQYITGGASYRILRNLSLVGSITYRDRESDLTVFRNDAVIYSFGVAYHTTF
jgi:hypothetical protein